MGLEGDGGGGGGSGGMFIFVNFLESYIYV